MNQPTLNPEIAAVIEVVRQGLLQRNARTIAEAYAPGRCLVDADDGPPDAPERQTGRSRMSTRRYLSIWMEATAQPLICRPSASRSMRR